MNFNQKVKPIDRSKYSDIDIAEIIHLQYDDDTKGYPPIKFADG